MDVDEHLDALRREGELLVAAAAKAGLDAAVPTCPEWRVRDLVAHTGGVHRWAAAHVGDALVDEMDDVRVKAVFDSAPADDALLDWCRAGHAALVRTLASAPADTQCWTFMAAPSPVAFWARRQAHETSIHRIDAEIATGDITTFEGRFAADGIDEILTGFLPRRSGRFTADPAHRLAVTASDT